MKEKLLSLSLAELKEIAKASGLKGTSTMKKEALVDLLVLEDQKRKANSEKEDSKKINSKKTDVRKINDENAESKRTRSEKIDAKKTGVKKADTNKVDANKVDAKKVDTPKTKENNIGEKTDEVKAVAVKSRTEKTENGNSESSRGTNVSRQDSSVASPSPEKRYIRAAIKRNANENSEENSKAMSKESDRSVAAATTHSASATHAPASNTSAPSRPIQDVTTYVPQEGDQPVNGILEVLAEGYGFIRSDNYLPGDQDVYVSPQQIRYLRLRTGDILTGIKKAKGEKEKFSPLSYLEKVNGLPAKEISKRTAFENLTPIFPNKRIRLATAGSSVAMRTMDLVSPVGYGQRGMIVSPPKAGKTTLLKEVAHSILKNDPDAHLLILLIDERPEEVTDIKEAIIGKNVEVIYSTFDEQPEHHMRVSEMVIERAKRLVEQKDDVIILLDSITRLTRAYNQVIPPSGRTLSGGLDPAALHMPKRFFGAARNMREGGSLTILATALVETGSKMDDVVYEEFKGTGNMEIILDRKLSEKRIFPAIDLAKSGTRREDLLLNNEEREAINIMRKALNGLKPDEATDRILNMFANTKNNLDFVQLVKKNKFL